MVLQPTELVRQVVYLINELIYGSLGNVHLAVAVGGVQYERTLASACMCIFSTPGVIIWKAIFSDIFYLNKSRPSISYSSPVTAEGQGPSLTQTNSDTSLFFAMGPTPCSVPGHPSPFKPR